jgi:hypothetical protein
MACSPDFESTSELIQGQHAFLMEAVSGKRGGEETQIKALGLFDRPEKVQQLAASRVMICEQKDDLRPAIHGYILHGPASVEADQIQCRKLIELICDSGIN